MSMSFRPCMGARVLALAHEYGGTLYRSACVGSVCFCPSARGEVGDGVDVDVDAGGLSTCCRTCTCV